MSYAAGVALQAAVYQQLRADVALSDLVGDAVYDAMPVEAPSGVYVSLGPDDARDAGDVSARGSRHDFVVSVLSGTDETDGFGAVKEVASAVSAVLESGETVLAHGHLAGMWFLRAKARRVENGAARRVDLTFRARIDLG
ncbi:DUF3168 domain-containing protein [Paracoccus tegillarcae]|uniref:DUF3168 domain-containing protein n=1 Tax=Paracoccus tegillarcae TaxID=1529068 RepID=A0A2K9F4T4_9RHOB|nr:DUF3168 domain-containing protein [Paracoccus tegillarcae]AUH34161.1 DUF3168 domain-containing protein [Paracoccus tegillarcae]